jgi:hypothetical protein
VRQEGTIRRRELVLTAVAAATCPFAAPAQQAQRRVSVVMLYPENDPQGELRANAFRGQLEKAGWTIGGNLRRRCPHGRARRLGVR